MGVRTIHPNIPGLCRGDAVMRVQVDREKVGPAKTRNACLKALYDQGCDHFFLFDDDCYPVMAGWEDYFVQQHQRSGIGFFGLAESFKSAPLRLDGEVLWWDGLVGCFSSQTRAFMDAVGYYNTAYDRYGYEDAGRNLRALRSGLCGDGAAYPSLLRADAYIHSMDVFGENPTPNLSHAEKLNYIEINRPIFEAEVGGQQIYYPPNV